MCACLYPPYPTLLHTHAHVHARTHICAEEKKLGFLRKSITQRGKVREMEERILKLLRTTENPLAADETVEAVQGSWAVVKELTAKQAEVDSFEAKCEKGRSEAPSLSHSLITEYLCKHAGRQEGW